KPQRRKTPLQLRILEAAYGVSKKLNPELREILSKECRLTVREVKVWFQNRRMKDRR
ncbi:homeobox domain-containing protein, partial [Blyttiomyces helicus]